MEHRAEQNCFLKDQTLVKEMHMDMGLDIVRPSCFNLAEIKDFKSFRNMHHTIHGKTGDGCDVHIFRSVRKNTSRRCCIITSTEINLPCCEEPFTNDFETSNERWLSASDPSTPQTPFASSGGSASSISRRSAIPDSKERWLHLPSEDVSLSDFALGMELDGADDAFPPPIRPVRLFS